MYIENKAFAGISPRISARPEFTQLYHGDVVNHCPCCDRAHWMIGRSTAECAFCETALPLAAIAPQSTTPMFYYRGTRTAMAA